MSPRSKQKEIRLAVVGTGGMANFQAQQFLAIPGVKIVAVCDVDKTRAQEFATKHGAQEVYTDFDKMLRESDFEALTNVTPDPFHAPLTLKALAAKKHVLCEKPLATNYADAQKMVVAAKKAKVINMVNFSYRKSAAIQKAHELIQAGRIGRVVHVEGSYLQSWLACDIWGPWRTTPAWLWRQSTKHGSKGVLGDVGVHIFDFASFPVGKITKVNARLKAFTEIKGKRLGEYPLDANDSAVISVEFANGALGTLHTTRWASGHANSVKLRIYGDKGAISIDLDSSYDVFQICAGKDVVKAKWKEIKCKETPGNVQRFITSIRTGVNDQPDFATGAYTQKLIDACFESDARGIAIKI